jgi:glycosyltransferase involved in cell wall biosynthesis
MNSPLISVCLITYNHVKYIRKAIESVLMQKVDFSWELIIADDFSTDGTREIILEYKDNHPNLLKLIFQKNNVGPAQNWIDLITAPTTKYIAYIEGDDYWIDPLKLQKQVDLLEVYPQYSFCFHNALVLNENLIINPYYFNKPNQKIISTVEDLINNWYISSSSLFFHRKHIDNLPEWFSNLYSGDYALELILASKGDGYYSNDIMSVYRQNSGNLSSQYNNLKVVQSHIELFNSFNQFTNFIFDNLIEGRINQLKWNLKIALFDQKHPIYKKFKLFLKKFLSL